MRAVFNLNIKSYELLRSKSFQTLKSIYLIERLYEGMRWNHIVRDGKVYRQPV